MMSNNLTLDDKLSIEGRVQEQVERILTTRVYEELTQTERAQCASDLFAKLYAAEVTAAMQAIQPPLSRAFREGTTIARDIADAVRESTNMRSVSSLALDELEKALPLKYQREILQALQPPLSKGDGLPPPQDLSDHWERCENIIKGLGDTVEPEYLNLHHIRNLAPFILGGPVWNVVRHEPVASWERLKKAVEKRFGLTKEQLLDAFFAMRPTSGETSSQFILRVEDKRVRYQIEETQCYRTFAPQLDAEDRSRLDLLREFTATVVGQPTLTWTHLVDRARFQTLGTKLAPGKPDHILSGFGPTSAAPPLPGNVAVVPASGPEPPSPKPSRKTSTSAYVRDSQVDFVAYDVDPPCALCLALGRVETAPGHILAQCYANPKSDAVRPRVARARMAQLRQLKASGATLPPEVAELLTVPLPKLPGPPAQASIPQVTHAQVQAGYRDFQAMLEEDAEADPVQCYRESMEANGVRVVEPNLHFKTAGKPSVLPGTTDLCPTAPVPDFHPCLAFRDLEDLPDLQATTQAQRSIAQRMLEYHLEALASFPDSLLKKALAPEDPDLQAAGTEDEDDNMEDDDDATSLTVSVASSTSSEAGEEELAAAKLRKYVQQLTGKKVRDSGQQTGGPGAKYGKKAGGDKKKKKVTTTGDAVGKMRVAMPLLASMAARPYLRDLLVNYAVHTAHKTGHPVMILKGQKTLEVTESRLLAERKILEEGDLHRPDKVRKKLEEMRKQRKSATQKRPVDKRGHDIGTQGYIKQCADGLLHLLECLGDMEIDDEDDENHSDTTFGEDETELVAAPDLTLWSRAHPKARRSPMTPLNRHTNPPAWAEGYPSHLGILPLSKNHFIAQVAINGCLIEAIVDTGGARSIIDQATARLLALPLDVATENNHGCFWGPGAAPVHYYGIVPGPVVIHFSEDLSITLPELKVVRHAEPLVILGADVMMQRGSGQWSFRMVGIDPHRGGLMTFSNGRKTQITELVCWPVGGRVPPARKVRFTTPLQATDQRLSSSKSSDQSLSAAGLVALIKNRGGRLQEG